MSVHDYVRAGQGRRGRQLLFAEVMLFHYDTQSAWCVFDIVVVQTHSFYLFQRQLMAYVWLYAQMIFPEIAEFLESEHLDIAVLFRS